MRTLCVLVVLFAAVSSPSWAQEADQTDWRGGGSVSGPVAQWADTFESSTGVSWMSVPGQLALSSSPLTTPSEYLLNDEYYLAFGIDSADFDGDGDTDLVGTAEASRILAIWWNNGDSPVTFTREVIATPNQPSAVRAADIDSDGHVDIVATINHAREKVAWWRNGGDDPITWTKQDIDGAWGGAYEVFTDDVNQDGHLDVLSTAWERQEVAWWENDGGDPIVWTKHVVDGDFLGAHSVCTGDFDDDGDVDLVGTSGLIHQVAWWRNDGGDPIFWTKTVLDTQFVGGRSVCTADFDGDGDVDFAGTCWDHHVKWWRNDGGDPIVWTPFTIRAHFDGGHSIRAADVNGDGRVDLLAAGFILDAMAWWENNGGDPVSWTEHMVATSYDGAIEVHSGDVDGDGALEVLGTSYNLGEFTWWEVTEFGTSGELTSSVLDTQGSGLGSIDWVATNPAGTSLHFQVRSSDDFASMGSWSGDINTPANLGALDRYVQYKVVLGSADPAGSPILDRVVFGPPLAGVESGSLSRPARSLAASPNPFNPQATISFAMDREEKIRISVYSATGRRVRTLADGVYAAGPHQLSWDGQDNHGRSLPSGMYLVRLEAPGYHESKKLVLLR
jgi:hypothetical protein